MNLRETWEQIANEVETNTPLNTICRRVIAKQPVDLFIGVTPSGTKVLLLQIPNAVKKIPAFKARGLQLATVTIPGPSGDAYYWQLSLTNKLYFDLFLAVVGDIAASLSVISEKKTIPSIFLKRLSIWQEFLSKFSMHGLTEQEQRGLVGELFFLNGPMTATIGLPLALNAWKGPKRMPRDFQYVDRAVEVKTTCSKQHVAISISNEKQLDDTGLEVLLLCHIPLLPVETAGVSLPELVEKLRNKCIKEGIVDEFDSKLNSSGYLDAHAELYASNRYRILDAAYYKVREGFPRILSKNLSSGVGDIRYSISVGALESFKITPETALSILKL